MFKQLRIFPKFVLLEVKDLEFTLFEASRFVNEEEAIEYANRFFPDAAWLAKSDKREDIFYEIVETERSIFLGEKFDIVVLDKSDLLGDIERSQESFGKGMKSCRMRYSKLKRQYKMLEDYKQKYENEDYYA